MSAQSIAVVGGGLIGLSIAWRLVQAGFRVTVLEKGTIGSEASWAGAGMLSPGGEVDSPSQFAAQVVEARGLYRSFVRELEDASQIAIDYQECGALDLAYSQPEWTTLTARAVRQETFGVRSRGVNPQQVAAFWPRVQSHGLVGALFYPDDAIVNPRDLVAALTATCRSLEVEFLESSPVYSVRILPSAAEVETAAGNRLFAAAVIAAGAWSSSISVENVEALPMAEPIKGHLIGYQQPAQTCNTILRRGHTYLLQRENGLLIAGASVEHAGWNRAVDPQIAAGLAQEAASILPHLAETDPSQTWIGFRPGSERVQVGRWQSDSLYLAYGHFRNGILLAPLTALHIARAISASWQTPHSARV